MLQIVFCDGAPLNRTVRLYSVCANSFMKVNATGNVRADNAEDGFGMYYFNNISLNWYLCYKQDSDG